MRLSTPALLLLLTVSGLANLAVSARATAEDETKVEAVKPDTLPQTAFLTGDVATEGTYEGLDVHIGSDTTEGTLNLVFHNPTPQSLTVNVPVRVTQTSGSFVNRIFAFPEELSEKEVAITVPSGGTTTIPFGDVALAPDNTDPMSFRSTNVHLGDSAALTYSASNLPAEEEQWAPAPEPEVVAAAIPDITPSLFSNAMQDILRTY